MKSIVLNDKIKLYCNSQQVNKDIQKEIIIKSKFKKDDNNWQIYCKIFNTLSHNELLLYLYSKNIFSYKDKQIEKYKQRELCNILRNDKDLQKKILNK